MIENMYPIPKTEADIAKHSRKLPRNIRACGQGGGPLPVYLEDYVETYIRRMAETGFPNCSAMILVGQVMETETGRCLFVRGGINANKICEGDRPAFGEEIWSEVYEKIRRFFPDNEVVGWCIAGPGFRMLQEDVFLRAHIDNFGDSEKIFIAYESLEKELTIRICRYGSFCTLPGYYIYYEKNDEMQNYMLDGASYLHPQADKSVKEAKKTEDTEPLEKNAGKQVSLVRKDIFQLGAIACIIILIISVMVGTDALSLIKESVYANGMDVPGTTMAEEKTEKQDAEPAQDPDAFAFGDFDFLDDEPETPVAVKKEEIQEIGETDKPKEGKQTAVSDEKPAEPEADKEQTLASENTNQLEPGEEQTEEEQKVAIQEPEETTEPDDPDRIEEETVTVLAPSEYSAYTVKPGDTLAQMCKEIYGTVELLDYICELNQLESVDRIYVGQELIFPKK